MGHSFEARLVPLNKQWPEIPSKEQFRPIVILSPLFKWLELRFVWKLSEYPMKRLDIHYTEFVRGMGTHVNLLLLIKKLRSTRKKESLCAAYIDYKSACNSVLRDHLYRSVVSKQILTTAESDFLRSMHNCLHCKAGMETFYLSNGVH